MRWPDDERYFDKTCPQPARVWGAFWGSKDTYVEDREVVREVLEAYPTACTAVLHCRRFHQAAIDLVARDGITQFVDIGAGFAPSVDATARNYCESARTVYLDNDPMVLTHGRAYSTGVTHWTRTDVSEPGAVLAAVRDAPIGMDLREPVAVSMVGTSEFLGYEAASKMVREVMDALVPGSVLIATAAAADTDHQDMREVARTYRNHGIEPYEPITYQEFADYFDSLTFKDPGIVTPDQWPAPNELCSPCDIACYAAVAVKPAKRSAAVAAVRSPRASASQWRPSRGSRPWVRSPLVSNFESPR